MATKSHNIRIDEKIKEEATAVFATLGLTLSDAVNVFLRVSLEENGFPFPVRVRGTKSIVEKRGEKFGEFLAFAKANPVFERGYKFDRDDCQEQ